jgi:hypothetical protein
MKEVQENIKDMYRDCEHIQIVCHGPDTKKKCLFMIWENK